MKTNSFLDIYHQDKVLRKLILMSEDNNGIIDYTDDFCSYFGKIPPKSLFKILSILSECLYIDIDYFDIEEHSFDHIYIMAKGYNHLPHKRSDNIRYYLPLFISLCSLATSIAAVVLQLMQG